VRRPRGGSSDGYVSLGLNLAGPVDDGDQVCEPPWQERTLIARLLSADDGENPAIPAATRRT